MTWYEILIALAAASLVVIPIVKKIRDMRTFLKTGKVKCDGSCSCCGACPHACQKSAQKKNK